MIIPDKLKIGDTIGVCAPSDPITSENIEEINEAKKKVEEAGFKVKFSNNMFSNTNKYSATAKEKAEDLNELFADKKVKMIWCAKGGSNSNSLFEYLDYELIKANPKIICGYSDITSITNIINAKTGLVTFSGTNFKTIATDETDFSFDEVINRFVNENLEIRNTNYGYRTIKEGQAEGALIGGNLNLFHQLIAGKYKVDCKNKILFLEELGFETEPSLASNFINYMKQNGIFDEIVGLWLGNYTHETEIQLEQIVLNELGNDIKFPIIKSNNFGHIEEKTVIPIGTKAKIDTNKEVKIKLIEDCVK